MRPRQAQIITKIFVLLIVAGVLLPVVYLLIRATEPGAGQLQQLVFRQHNRALLINTLLLALLVVICTQAIALPLAWLVTRTDVKWRRTITLLCVVPLAVPPYIKAYVFRALGGDYGTSAQLFGLATPTVSGLFGAVLALTLCHFPYLFLPIRAALLRGDPSLEEAARLLGCSRFSAFWRIVYPQLKPALSAGRLLIVLHVLADFGVVSLMRYDTFSSAIYTALFDRTYAAWLALLLLLVTTVILTIEYRLLRGLNLASGGGRLQAHPVRSPLGSWRFLAFTLVGGLLLLSVALPAVTVTFWLTKSTVASGIWLEMAVSLWHSLVASAPAALLTTIIAAPLAFVIVRMPSRFAQIAEAGSYIAYATPPLAFALGLVFFSLKVEIFYKTLTLLILAYTLRYLAEALGPIKSHLQRATPTLEEAARTLGSSPANAFTRVTLPLTIGGILVSMAFVFLSVMKELPLALLLSPLDFNPLAINVWSYVDEAMFAEAAPFALVLVAVSGCFVGLLLTTEKKAIG